MRKIITLISVCFLLFGNVDYAQSVTPQGNNSSGTTTTKDGKKFQTKWKTNPFDNQVFIQNNGQFDGKIKSGEKILYGVQFGSVNIYFTENTVVYRYDKNYFKKTTEPNDDADDPKNLKHESYFLKAEWQGANKNATVIAKGEKKDYYTYGIGEHTSIKANIFKQIIYKNLYPGIDAVYQFIEGKSGIKYSLIVHPGADLSAIKLSYSGAKSISKNREGDIIIHSDLDLLTEHAPVTSYQGEGGDIVFSNVITGNTESFKADENYDKSKTIVIDPWITDPLFTPLDWDKAYDLDWDYKGNVYAYGGDATGTLQFVKMNNLGVIQWTYNAVSISGFCYGDFCTDKVTGTSYLCQGFPGGHVVKVNTLGVYIATSPGNPNLQELWRTEYDACNRRVIIAGGGTSGIGQAGVLDTTMALALNAVNVMGVGGALHDCSLLTLDPNGNQAYMASAQSQGFPTIANNVIMQLPLPTLTPTLYKVHENCGFQEVLSVPYCGQGGGNYATNAMNGAAASPSWLYLYNGDTLRRFHKNTGALTTQYSIRLNTPFRYGGLDVDACDNLFFGVDDSIFVVDSTYAIQAKIPLQDTVFDVHLGESNILYACGRGYVTQLTNPVTPNLISSAAGTPTSCSVCNGTATVNINCGIAPYSFLWNDGTTNQTDTGLCAGVYTVTVKDAACPPRTDTATVAVTGEGGFSATAIDTNPDCGLRKGSAYADVVGGHSPYTFSWSNGSTNQKDTGLIAGSYTCIITDNAGCKYRISLRLINPSAPDISIVPISDSICLGGNIGLIASGTGPHGTYAWTPAGSGLSCYNCPNPTATPTATVTYTVTGTDSNGCTNVATSRVIVRPAPNPVITGPDTACVGANVTLNVSGGGTYVWAPGGATTSSISFIASTTQTYTVTASNGACSSTATTVLTVVPAATASIAASKDSVCSGDTLTLEGQSGLKYKWSPGGATTSNIHVTLTTTKTFTLNTYSGTCKDSTTITIPVIKTLTATARTTVDSICPGGSAILSVTSSGGGGSITYFWSPGGATSSSLTVIPPSTTTYTVTVNSFCGPIQKTVKVVVVPLPYPVITGTPWKCRGVRDTLVVSDTTGHDTYVWSNGKTTTSIYTGLIDADSTIGVTAYNKLGCPATTTFSIALRTPLTISFPTPPIFCAGQNVCITANVAGNPLSPVSYAWSDGETTSTICVTPTDTTSYSVTVSNGCKSTKSTVLNVNQPNLSACCSQTLSIINDTVTPSQVVMVAGGNSTKYAWAPSVNCLNPICDSVMASPTPSVTTIYTVTGTDANGCQISQLITITVDVPCFNLIVPNVFTPTNGGTLGLDKVFYIDTRNIAAWSITIFDRWGKTVFTTSDQYKYWDGTTTSGGPAPAGVYYYIITGTCQNTTYKRDGFLQLIR